MSRYRNWLYPEIPADIALLLESNIENLVIVGVVGRSTAEDCNKLAASGILERPACTIKHTPREGQIQFHYKAEKSLLILHFETTYDSELMQQMLETEVALGTHTEFHDFQQRMRSRFARTLLFVLHVCHIVVYVELSLSLDPGLLTLLRLLKIIRERHVQRFLPKLLKNSSAGVLLGKPLRLCTPRLLFLFENYPSGYEKTKDSIRQLEFNTEDSIYSQLFAVDVISEKSMSSLVAIPSNKQFVYFNTNDELHADVVEKSLHVLKDIIKKAHVKPLKHDDDLLDLAPFKGFGRPTANAAHSSDLEQFVQQSFETEHTFMQFLEQHVQDALTGGFDDGGQRQRNFHFKLVPFNAWYDIFQELHKIFIENHDDPTYETNEVQYKMYLENFDTYLNGDLKFFMHCSENGLKRAFAKYKQLATTLYNSQTHAHMLGQCMFVFNNYARGPCAVEAARKLEEMCRKFWENGRQTCEKLSLRGNPCVLPKEMSHDNTQHTSGQVFVSTCNCGRTQGRRDDPYAIRQANYEYYEFMAGMCNLCAKVKKIPFDIFEPSSSDYRAAAFEMAFPNLKDTAKTTGAGGKSSVQRDLCDELEYDANECSQPMTVTFGSGLSLSTKSFMKNSLELEREQGAMALEDIEEQDSDSESLNENELILQIKEKCTTVDVTAKECQEEVCTERAPEDEDRLAMMRRQASTTEYLPGLIHTLSAEGLLPLFPSWSLACVGASSIYSHNVGLMEHFQSGFLSGANFLLPWDVHVRLQRVPAAAAGDGHGISMSSGNGGKQRRYRKKGDLIVLKVFVGFEYECARGHRFIMCAPDKVLRGGADIGRDMGSNVVNHNMPLYYPCPCHSQQTEVAQLMRVHVVTPKAPVNVIVNPKIRTGEQEFIFTLGLSTPPRLTQSAYWILRLPYIYQGDDVLIMPPTSITGEDALKHGCLLAGMFGVAETLDQDDEVSFNK